MKKQIIGILATLSLLSGAAVYAEDISYDMDRNAVNNNVAGYRTVIIAEQDNANNILYNNILYVDQNDSDFDASVRFLLKEDITAGTYVVSFGGLGEIKTSSFTITDEAVKGERSMPRVGSDTVEEGETGRVGFTVADVYIPAYSSILVSYSSDGQTVTLGYPLSSLIDANIDSNISFGLQINDVPAEYMDSINVSLSKQEVALQ